MKRLIFLNIVLLIAFTIVDVAEANALTVDQKVQILLSKAQDLSKKGNHPAALKFCNEAIKLKPRNLAGYYVRGFVFGRMKVYKNAIENFSVVISKDERNNELKFPKARKFRADCYLGLGIYEYAAKDYLMMLKKNSKSDRSGKIWFYLAETYALMGENRAAFNAIKNGCETGSHWCGHMKALQQKILLGKKITPHKPLSN